MAAPLHYCAAYGGCYISMLHMSEDAILTPLAQARSSTNKAESAGLLIPAWCLLMPVLALLAVFLVAIEQPDGRLHMWVLDVGQGDAILVQTPRGHTALINGGPGATPLLNGLGAHMPVWQHNLDLVALTRPRQENLMGLPELLDRYGVAQVVQTEFTPTAGLQAEWANTLKLKSIPVRHVSRGERISFEGEPDVWFDVLSPTNRAVSEEQPTSAGAGDVSNSSLVLRLNYGPHSILLAGDGQAATEAELVSDGGAELRSTVFKVAQHGDKAAVSTALLSSVKPKVAIISVGAGNRFGQPAPETLNALEQAGAATYRTDQNGTIEVIADMSRLWVRSER